MNAPHAGHLAEKCVSPEPFMSFAELDAIDDQIVSVLWRSIVGVCVLAGAALWTMRGVL